jgi:GDP-4-dehydro-6-deoxy-D-mannose reductase
VRILVTGSGGFVGGWLVQHLIASADDVVQLGPDVDVRDRAAIGAAVADAMPDAICHLAGQASVQASWADPIATYEVNTLGAVNVLDAASACSSRPRVLLISTSEVYGRVTPADLPLREDHPFAPVSPYAASKAASELVGVQAGLGTGLEVVRVRPFNHTGPGQRPDFVVPALAQQVAAAIGSGAPALLTGNLEPRRDLTDVRDVVRAYRDLLEGGTPGEVYNVCRGEAVSIREIAAGLLAAAGVDLPITVDPARARPVDLPELRGDPSRLHAATGWAPKIPLETTLADVLAYWQRQATDAAGR